MPLSSLLQRFRQMAAAGHTAAPELAHVSPSDVEAARVRARRRLIGMVVLVGAGVVGFPWLFETQPRPMSPDVEMVQAHAGIGGGEDGLSVARGAPSRTASGKVAVADIVPPAPSRRAEAPKSRRDADTEADASRESMSSKPPVAVAARASAERPKSPDKAAVKEPAAKPAAKDVAAKEAASKTVAKPSDKPADKDKATAKADSRYVVQFGAFADANAARAVRMKVERLGIKTYAQQVETPAGKRVRVRIGPFTDKAEADKALATLRKAGLTGSVLTL